MVARAPLIVMALFIIVALGFAGRTAIEEGGPTPISHLEQGDQDLIVLGAFGLMAFSAYAAVRSTVRYHKSPDELRIYRVDSATVRRLRAQERGEDPAPIDAPAPPEEAPSAAPIARKWL